MMFPMLWLLLSLPLFLSILGVAPTLAASDSSLSGVQRDTSTSVDRYWEEEIPPQLDFRTSTGRSDDDNHHHRSSHDNNNNNNKDKPKPRRPVLLWRPLERQMHTVKYSQTTKEVHPLRTNVWRIRLTLRKRNYIPDKYLVVEFDARGYCKVIQQGNNRDDTKTLTADSPISYEDSHEDDPIYMNCVGKWNMIPAGVFWNFSTLQFWAELHLQPFADHPRMLRGIIIRERYVNACKKLILCSPSFSRQYSLSFWKHDRSDKSFVPKHWFRPVVGTFEAVGIGEDFTDLSYSDRGFSLDSTHTFLK